MRVFTDTGKPLRWHARMIFWEDLKSLHTKSIYLGIEGIPNQRSTTALLVNILLWTPHIDIDTIKSQIP